MRSPRTVVISCSLILLLCINWCYSSIATIDMNDNDIDSSLLASMNDQRCLQDIMHMSRPATYPNATAMRSYTGTGDYGTTVYLGQWDPGKWRMCIDLGETIARYCYVSATIGEVGVRISVGACAPSSCSASDIQMLPPALVTEKLNLPLLFAAGFNVTCDAAKQGLPASGVAVMTLVCLFASLAVLATCVEYALNHQWFSFGQQYSRANYKEDDDDEERANHKDDMSEDRQLHETYSSGHQSHRRIDEIDEEVENETRARLIAEKYATKMAISDTMRRSGPIYLRVLLFWSVTHNFARLIAPPPPGNLEALNGVRVLSMVVVVLGHTYYFMWFCLGITNMNYLIHDIIPTFRFQVIPAGFYAVDSFFWLSGFLVAYLLIKQLQKHGLTISTLPLLYLHRIIRLTPGLILALLIYWKVAPYISDGPNWKFFQYWTSKCDATWWQVVLYIQNFWNNDSLCFGWAWYLAADLQLFLISPIFIIVYHFNRNAGWGLTILALSTVIWTNVGIAWDNQLQAYPAMEFLSDPLHWAPPGGSSFQLVYEKPWTRAGPYFVGFICAFLLLENGGKLRIRPLIRTMLYVLSIGLLTFLTFITYTLFHSDWNLAVNVVMIGLNRTLWGVGLGILVMLCVSGYGGVLRSFLESPFWVPFARLSYAAYLYHLINIGVVYMSFESNYTYQLSTIMYFFVGHTIVAYILGFLHWMLFEKPLMSFESAFLFPSRE